MTGVSRRVFLGSATATAITAATSGCTPRSDPSATTGPTALRTSRAGSTADTSPTASASRTTSASPRTDGPIGDGSTQNTGPQPHQPKPKRLKPGEIPPQFVVFSWDGAADLSTGLFPRFRSLAQETGAVMTFFLSGLYALPEKHRMLYHPPRHPQGSSAIGFLNTPKVVATMGQVRKAWLQGHEIGTHFNGHFCGTEGVGRWSSSDWASEIAQAKHFVKTWRTTTATVQDDSVKALPFDKSRHALSMDYNFMFKQSNGNVHGNPAMYSKWRAQARDAYLAGFHRAHSTNRAPLFIGNHFEQWNGGIYMDAVEEALRTMAKAPGVQLVSFRQLVDWLDVQDPQTLTQLRTLRPGQRPADGWKSFLT